MGDLIQLSEVSNDVFHLVGGKGGNLLRLTRLGLSVPDAFIVPSQVFIAYIKAIGLGSFCGEGGWSNLEAEVAAQGGSDAQCKAFLDGLQETVRAGCLPESVSAAITTHWERLGKVSVAVRSSAMGEDSGAASFAGQYDTFLNIGSVQDLLESVKKCWASVFSYRSFVYRQREGGTVQELAIAVVVQEMVSAEVSGVIFTTDPIRASSNQVLIEAAWGLGEGIVDGRVTTDSYTYDGVEKRITGREIRYKLLKSERAVAGGTRLIEVAPAQREVPSLTDGEVATLADVALAIRDAFNAEQDVEWSLAGGRLFILQSRPITNLDHPGREDEILLDPLETVPEVEANTLWSMMDVGEATAGIMSPLGQGFMRYYGKAHHSACLRASGILKTEAPHRYLGFIYGRCYLNISCLAHLYGRIPPLRDQRIITSRFINDEVDQDAYRSPFKYGLSEWAIYPASVAFWFYRKVKAGFENPRRKAEKNRNKTYDDVIAMDYEALSDLELTDEILKREKTLLNSMTHYFPFYFHAMGRYAALKMLCEAYLKEEKLEDALKADMSELRTIDVTEDLWRVCARISENGTVRQIICSHESDAVKERLLAHPEGALFWTREIEPLLRKHGVRGKPPEFDLAEDRWVDNPALLFSLAEHYVRTRFDLHAVAEKASKKRTHETQRVLKTLPFFKRMVLKRAIRSYYRFAETREITRMWTMTETWVMQRLVREIGRRLVQRGVLHHVDEIAYLDFQDLLLYGTGKIGLDAFSREEIERRRREHIFNHRVQDPPLTVVGPFRPGERFVPAENGACIQGLGSSPGVVTGKARLIMDVHRQAGEFQVGEILVTHFTNATWTPLFVTAAAVVTDLGSMLAHSSVVAREYGIPAVVNTKSATRMILTGDELVVDGTGGHVRIVQRAEEAPVRKTQDVA